jgi:Ni/Fe-hydrogenase subunit HybB-like protein
LADQEHSLPPLVAQQPFDHWFMRKLRMDMSWQDYARSLVTPFNLLVAAVLVVGIPLIVVRFVYGLETVTHGSDDYPWGLLIFWGLFALVPLSATGFTMASAYYIFGFRRYAPMVRIGVLAGFLGYLFAVCYLLIDMGRPWRIYYPMAVSFGMASVLFSVAWHVAVYLTVQLLEFSPAILEWLQSKRVRRWATKITVAMTIAGIILTTLHQAGLGAMYQLAPGRLHALWYSQFLPELFLASSVYVAIAMMIVICALVARFMPERCDETFLGSLDRLTIGLGQAAAIAMYVYFVMKMISVAHDREWDLLGTPYGYWFLVETVGFVLLPALVLTLGVKVAHAGVVRIGAWLAVIGLLLNRLNVCIVAFNWDLPGHLQAIVPTWQEVVIALTLTAIHVVLFRWIVNRMPVAREESGFKAH